jgi:hypothetical protein
MFGRVISSNDFTHFSLCSLCSFTHDFPVIVWSGKGVWGGGVRNSLANALSPNGLTIPPPPPHPVEKQLETVGRWADASQYSSCLAALGSREQLNVSQCSCIRKFVGCLSWSLSVALEDAELAHALAYSANPNFSTIGQRLSQSWCSSWCQECTDQVQCTSQTHPCTTFHNRPRTILPPPRHRVLLTCAEADTAFSWPLLAVRACGQTLANRPLHPWDWTWKAHKYYDRVLGAWPAVPPSSPAHLAWEESSLQEREPQPLVADRHHGSEQKREEHSGKHSETSFLA